MHMLNALLKKNYPKMPLKFITYCSSNSSFRLRTKKKLFMLTIKFVQN